MSRHNHLIPDGAGAYSVSPYVLKPFANAVGGKEGNLEYLDVKITLPWVYSEHENGTKGNILGRAWRTSANNNAGKRMRFDYHLQIEEISSLV